MTTLVRLGGTVVAVAGPTRYYLAPQMADTGQDDPARQIAALMCLYARRLALARREAEYTDEEAEVFARFVLGAAQADEPD